jgi:hypothetical protein
LETERSHRVPNQGSAVGGLWQPFSVSPGTVGDDGSVRRGVVMVKQPGPFSPEFGATSSHVFTQSPQNVAVEPGINNLACWDRCFALPQLLYRWRHQCGIFWTSSRRHSGKSLKSRIHTCGLGFRLLRFPRWFYRDF